MAKDLLPDAARVLPPAGQATWLKAFKEARLKGLPEDEASAFAWAAVKRAGYHRKSNGKWGKMMDAELTVAGDDLILGIPFVKINAKGRTVSGFATLDNIDKAGDVLDAKASQDAFAKWVGNIREMHERKAVGKSISVEQKQFTDESGETYNGIWITARISKGAEDTWQKVLDGTLSGFSVGGAVHEKERAIAKTADGDREIWRITKYSLNEVSLVDNPCNQLATVSLVKSIDGALSFEDIVDNSEDAELDGEPLEKAHAEGSADCCMGEIDNVLGALKAWRQRAIDKDQDGEVASISRLMMNVRNYKEYERYEHEDHERMSAAVNKSNESEGEPMAKTEEELQNNDESDISVSEDFTQEHKSLLRKMAEFILGEVPQPEAVAEETTEELEKEGDVTSDMNTEEVKGLVDAANEELTKSFDGKFTEIGDALTKIAEALETVAKSENLDELKAELQEQIEGLAGRVEAVETSGAVRKSGDVAEESLEKEDKGFWADSIVPEFLKKQV